MEIGAGDEIGVASPRVGVQSLVAMGAAAASTCDVGVVEGPRPCNWSLSNQRVIAKPNLIALATTETS